jgi:hypothetical protein
MPPPTDDVSHDEKGVGADCLLSKPLAAAP